MSISEHFSRVWAVDFEYRQPSGYRPEPHCVVAKELTSGRVIRQWLGDAPPEPPYGTGRGDLIVTFYGVAEANCHLALGWTLPDYHLDLYAEFRIQTNGIPWQGGSSLLGALNYYALDAMGATEKEDMRKLAMRGGPFSEGERSALLDYCEQDVLATAKLFRAMEERIDLARALIRGRYMFCVAGIEAAGIPVDIETLGVLRDHWDVISERIIQKVDGGGVYEGCSFRQRQWEQWTMERNISWPRLASGALALDQDTFRDMAQIHPEIAPYKELRATLSQLHIRDLPVGPDGRNRTTLSPFRSRTGRNQPKTGEFIFGPAKWMRSLIRPKSGTALAYLDYEQQEFGIAAALSRDLRMADAYESGDPYLAFAKQAGAVPVNATKDSHPSERGLFKTCALGVQYGMREKTLAARIRKSIAHARELINLHRATYPRYWRWSEGVQDYALTVGHLTASFGWSIRTIGEVNPCFLRNFPLQANGGEMLRLACILAAESGVKICAPVHDALLIEASEDEIELSVAACEAAMRKASEIVCGGMSLRVETQVIRFPERFPVAGSNGIKDAVFKILSEIKGETKVCHGETITVP